MKCYNHPDRDAIAQCGSCGKGLCEECAKKWNPPICDDCQRNNINAELKSINSELTLYKILATVGFVPVFGLGIILIFGHGDIVTGFISSLFTGILVGFALPSYVAGWKWMNHITDKFTLFATPVGWLIYFFIKLSCSALVGQFALPYRVYRINKKKKELKSLLLYMQ